jgi:hypothetical protein
MYVLHFFSAMLSSDIEWFVLSLFALYIVYKYMISSHDI